MADNERPNLIDRGAILWWGPTDIRFHFQKGSQIMKNVFVIGLLTMVVVGFAFGAGLASESVVIKGQVLENNQLMDEAGNVYDIVDTEAGNEVVELVGQKVEIQGTLMEDQDGKVIAIESFRIME
jgi:hypothetical protein